MLCGEWKTFCHLPDITANICNCAVSSTAVSLGSFFLPEFFSVIENALLLILQWKQTQRQDHFSEKSKSIKCVCLRSGVKSAADKILDLILWRAKIFLFFLVASLDQHCSTVLAFYTIAKTNAFDRFRLLMMSRSWQAQARKIGKAIAFLCDLKWLYFRFLRT